MPLLRAHYFIMKGLGFFFFLSFYSPCYALGAKRTEGKILAALMTVLVWLTIQQTRVGWWYLGSSVEVGVVWLSSSHFSFSGFHLSPEAFFEISSPTTPSLGTAYLVPSAELLSFWVVFLYTLFRCYSLTEDSIFEISLYLPNLLLFLSKKFFIFGCVGSSLLHAGFL